MPESSLTINSAGVAVRITSKVIKDIAALKKSVFLRRYIPAVEVAESSAITVSQLKLSKGSPQLILDYPKATYRNHRYNDADVVSLVEYLLERGRQQRGIYCLHGSACVIEGRAVIFWGGASGMGKTSLCHYLSNQCGAKWYGDEKLLIDLKHRCLLGRVDVAYLKNGKKNNYKNLKNDFAEPVPISFFVYPFITRDNDRRLDWEKWPEKKFYWHLFEELNRKIRATSRRLFNDQEPVMPLDTAGLARQRNNLIRKFIAVVPCYYCRGSRKNVSKKIYSYFNN